MAELERDRPVPALVPLIRAARLYHLLGEAAKEAPIHHRIGLVQLDRCAYDAAVERLLLALEAARRGAPSLVPRVHLALAAAYRGRGNLTKEREHGEMAVEHAGTTMGRVRASAVVARADLSAGNASAEGVLARCEQYLREAGYDREADQARAALFDARMLSGDAARAVHVLPVGPAHAIQRYAGARLDLEEGRMETACNVFEVLGADAALPAHLRAASYAHLADGLRRLGRVDDARDAAVASSALLEVRRRSRAHDAGLHDVLARVFSGVGDDGRAVGHARAARRGRSHTADDADRRAG